VFFDDPIAPCVGGRWGFPRRGYQDRCGELTYPGSGCMAKMSIDPTLLKAIDAQWQVLRWNDYAGFGAWLKAFSKATGIPDAALLQILQRFPDPNPRPAPDWQEPGTVAILRDPPDTDPLSRLPDHGWIDNDLADKLRLPESELTGRIHKDLEAARDIQENAVHILGRCNNPGKWGATNRRGLVYGMVQSGKTANMISLIALGRKAGYRLVILLAGDKDSLRNQTQYRFDRAFQLKNGMNMPDLVSSPTYDGDFLQTTNSYEANFEYHLRVARKQPWTTIIVIKKQRHNLEKLMREIRAMQEALVREGQDLAALFPTLILDDEADYGTPNTDPPPGTGSAIHNLIVELRKVIPHNTYVGYTATPQACLSADPNDEVGYPNDFFWLLEPYQVPRDGILVPKTYLGAYELFWEYERSLIRSIGRDEWPHHEKDVRGRPKGVYAPIHGAKTTAEEIERKQLVSEEAAFLDGLEKQRRSLPSLRDALLDFMLGCGVRWWREWQRGGSKALPELKDIDDGETYSHHAAMVHLSYNQENQGKIRRLVRKQWFEAVRLYEDVVNSKGNSRNAFAERWKSQLNRIEGFYAGTQIPKWEEIRPFVDLCIQVTQRPIHNHREPGYPLYPGSQFIYLLNSTDEGMELNYDPQEAFQIRTKKAAIVVGGNILSRGLTINGLSVSVFGRSARIPLGDATLQMGRWLGHKKGELDLITIYLQDGVKELFQQVALADDYLRRQIKDAIRSGFNPREVLLELRNSPFFRATSPQKSTFLANDGAGFGFAGKSTWLTGPSFNLEGALENVRLIEEFEQKAGKSVLSCGRARLYRGVDREAVIRLFESLHCQPDAPQATFSQYASYLKDWKKDEGHLPRMPRINVAVYNEVQRRQRKISTLRPSSEREAREQAEDWFPSVVGGKGSLAGRKGRYQGDAFLDKDEDWHEAHDRASSERDPGDDILIVLYPLHPTYLTRTLWDNSTPIPVSRPVVVLAEPGDRHYVGEAGVDPEKTPLWTFAVWTPAGGPLYEVAVNKLIAPTKVKMRGRVRVNEEILPGAEA
jgi:hypothetical protein